MRVAAERIGIQAASYSHSLLASSLIVDGDVAEA